MKKLNEAYVIVQKWAIHASSNFKGSISFDKNEIDAECQRMNDAENEICRKQQRKDVIWNDMEFFKVLSLDKAIEEFEYVVIDYWSEHDEGY